jgi:predicted ATPase
MNNLPIQLSSFIGRRREIAEVKQLLSESRLTTLTGAGGCGKTRLALQVAANLVGEYNDGVWLVELVSLADLTLVPQTVVAALGVREQPDQPILNSLLDYLHPKDMLLVLDNCEHLIEACARLADTLLRACPNLRILATSREALSIAGENSWTVPSLSLPDVGQKRLTFTDLS